MPSAVASKKFDLLDRTRNYSLDIRNLVRSLPVNIVTADDIKQLIRSSRLIGANYIEACEALSKKDFIHRIKIVRKEAKETLYWLSMLRASYPEELSRIERLYDEAAQLMKIFGAILVKVEK